MPPKRATAPKAVVAEAAPVKTTKTTTTKVAAPVPSPAAATTTTTTTKKTTTKAVVEPEPVVKKAPAPKKALKTVPTEDDLEKMKSSHDDYFATLKDETVTAEFIKIRQQLGIVGFDRALAKIQKDGGIQGNVAHNVKKSSISTTDKKKNGKDYEEYVRLRAAPHKWGGVVYLGHLPKGFTEEPMKKFFKQFGEIKRIHLPRSKKSGEVKGFAFIEFSDKQVAAIVAESMDKYMLFGRTLQCQYIPYDQLHPETFRNNFREFKQINFTQIHNDIVNQSKSDEKIVKMNIKQKKTLSKQAQKLADMGWDISDVAVQCGDEDIDVETLQPTKKVKKSTISTAKIIEAEEEKEENKKVKLPRESSKSIKASVIASKAVAKAALSSDDDEEEVVQEPQPKKRTRATAAAAVVEEVKPKATTKKAAAVVEEVKPKSAVKKVATKKTK